MRAMPSTAVKAHNRSAMTQYLYGHSHVTKQELERELGLSLPTITQNLRALEDDGLIRKGKLQDSTGGRKAQNYEFNPDHRTAIGVVMRSNELRLCAINLYGNVIEKRNDALPYRNTNVYYQRIGGIINNFAADVEKKHGKVLGVSFAIQGILSQNVYVSDCGMASKASSPPTPPPSSSAPLWATLGSRSKPSANRSITRA